MTGTHLFSYKFLEGRIFIVLLEVLNAYPKKPEYLIEILLALQKRKENHSFTQDELNAIAQYLDVPQSRVASVVSFYSFFTMKPKGKYVIQVCKDVPCYLNQTFKLFDLLKKELGIDWYETTDDLRFSIEPTSCLGCCDMSPVVRVNHKIYGNLTKDKVKVLLSELSGDQND